MAISTGAARYNTPVKYGKTLTLTMSDGTSKNITGAQAQRIQKYLEDNPRFIYFVTNEAAGTIEFYALSDSGCGFCKVAVLTPSATQTDPVACEDGLPNCPDDTDINPTTPSLTLSTQLVQMEVGKTATITAEYLPALPEGATITWTSGDTTIATVANGVVTGVKAGNTTITVSVSKTTGSGDSAVTTTYATGTVTVMVAAAGTLTNPITGGSTANK